MRMATDSSHTVSWYDESGPNHDGECHFGACHDHATKAIGTVPYCKVHYHVRLALRDRLAQR